LGEHLVAYDLLGILPVAAGIHRVTRPMPEPLGPVSTAELKP